VAAGFVTLQTAPDAVAENRWRLHVVRGGRKFAHNLRPRLTKDHMHEQENSDQRSRNTRIYPDRHWAGLPLTALLCGLAPHVAMVQSAHARQRDL